VSELGDADALDAWHEWERVAPGKNMITYSQGLRRRLELVDEQTDEDIADEDLGTIDHLSLPRETWHAHHPKNTPITRRRWARTSTRLEPDRCGRPTWVGCRGAPVPPDTPAQPQAARAARRTAAAEGRPSTGQPSTGSSPVDTSAGSLVVVGGSSSPPGPRPREGLM